MSGIYSIYLDGKFVQNVSATTLKDAKEYAKEVTEVYIAHGYKRLQVKQIAVLVKGRAIYFKDLKLNTEKEVKTIKTPMLCAILEGEFSNDNITFFMLERGLVEDNREQLSDKGRELVRCWEM